MAPTSPHLNFVNHSQGSRRSTRINEETWNRHKKLLCALYRSYPLGDVMTFMELRHKFTPSKRQYGYRFEKWGIRKYGKGDKAASPRPISELDQFVRSRENNDHVNLFDRTAKTHFLDIPSQTSGYPSPGSSHSASDNDVVLEDEAEEPNPINYNWRGDEVYKKLAADFCVAMSDDKNAFGLYLDLYKKISARPGTSFAAKDMLAKSCARSAEDPENARRANQMLSRHQSHSSASNRTFVFSMLAAYLRERDDEVDKSEAQKSTCDSIRVVLRNGTFSRIDDVPELSHGCSIMDLVAYQCLHHGLSVLEDSVVDAEGETLSSDCFLDQYVLKRFLHTRSGDNPLKPCLEWCSKQLDSNLVVPAEVAAIRPSDEQRQWADNIAIFCTLWDAMFRDTGDYSTTPDWYNDSEPAFGICASELLVTICWMIGEMALEGEGTTDVLCRAAQGVKDLEKLDDGSLLTKFLRRFTWMNKLVDSQDGEDDKGFERVVLLHVREYITATLGIQLPVMEQEAITELPLLDSFMSFSDMAGSDSHLLASSFGLGPLGEPLGL